MYFTHKHAAMTSEIIPLLYSPLEMFCYVTGTQFRGSEVLKEIKWGKNTYIKIVAVDKMKDML
jgi:hypothetical protein